MAAIHHLGFFMCMFGAPETSIYGIYGLLSDRKYMILNLYILNVVRRPYIRMYVRP